MTSTSTTPATVAAVLGEPSQASSGTALAAVGGLVVKGRAPKTGYSRESFGQAWFDADRNGCDTRNDMLRRDLSARSMKNWCKVLAGTLNPDPYTGASIRFEIGGRSEVDIDHVVALSDAWQKGAATWPAGERLSFANDPANLLAVASGANRAKGDGDAATWLPANKSYRCTYVAKQVAVKRKYQLWVTAAERDAMIRVLSGCATMPLPAAGSTTLVQPPRSSAPTPPRPSSPAPLVPRPAPAPKKTVTPPPPPAPAVVQQGCYPKTSAGNCYKAGQFCRKSDRGASGIAGNGEAITCRSSGSRWRWEPS